MLSQLSLNKFFNFIVVIIESGTLAFSLKVYSYYDKMLYIKQFVQLDKKVIQ